MAFSWKPNVSFHWEFSTPETHKTQMNEPHQNEESNNDPPTQALRLRAVADASDSKAMLLE